MAKNDELPEFRPKRKVLFGSRTSEEQWRETGKEFMSAGRYDDALEFFGQADADDLAEQVAREALSAGNVPLLMRARRVSGQETSESDWLAAAQAAESNGMFSGAALAYERAGRDDDAARMAQQMPGAPEEQPEQVLDEESLPGAE